MSNCIIFAILLWIRRYRKGDAGYIAMRKSHWGNFPHVLYVHRKKRWISYTPIDPRKRRFPPPLFLGRVKWGDQLKIVNRKCCY